MKLFQPIYAVSYDLTLYPKEGIIREPFAGRDMKNMV